MPSTDVEALTGPPVEDQRIELVESKGKGNLDTICDAVAESVSIGLCREYRRRSVAFTRC